MQGMVINDKVELVSESLGGGYRLRLKNLTRENVFDFLEAIHELKEDEPKIEYTLLDSAITNTYVDEITRNELDHCHLDANLLKMFFKFVANANVGLDNFQLETSFEPEGFKIKSSIPITLQVGDTKIIIASDKIEINGPTVLVNGQAL